MSLSEAIAADIVMMFEDWRADAVSDVCTYYRNVTAGTYNPKTGRYTVTKDNDIEIDTITKPYDLRSISMSNGALLMGDREFICIDKDAKLPYGELRQLPADPAVDDRIIHGDLAYEIRTFARDATDLLWVIHGRRPGGGA